MIQFMAKQMPKQETMKLFFYDKRTARLSRSGDQVHRDQNSTSFQQQPLVRWPSWLWRQVKVNLNTNFLVEQSSWVRVPVSSVIFCPFDKAMSFCQSLCNSGCSRGRRAGAVYSTVRGGRRRKLFSQRSIATLKLIVL